jgi:hypothetical protein
MKTLPLIRERHKIWPGRIENFNFLFLSAAAFSQVRRSCQPATLAALKWLLGDTATWQSPPPFIALQRPLLRRRMRRLPKTTTEGMKLCSPNTHFSTAAAAAERDNGRAPLLRHFALFSQEREEE